MNPLQIYFNSTKLIFVVHASTTSKVKNESTAISFKFKMSRSLIVFQQLMDMYDYDISPTFLHALCMLFLPSSALTNVIDITCVNTPIDIVVDKLFKEIDARPSASHGYTGEIDEARVVAALNDYLIEWSRNIQSPYVSEEENDDADSNVSDYSDDE